MHIFLSIILAARIVLIVYSPATFAQQRINTLTTSLKTGEEVKNKERPSIAVALRHRSTANIRPGKFVLIGAGVYLATRLDLAVDKAFNEEELTFPYSMFEASEEVGDLYDSKYAYYVLGGFSAAALGYSYISKNKGPAETVKLVLVSFAVSSAITSILKVTIGRRRPYTDGGPYRFTPFAFHFNTSAMSFPSGHTSSIFSMMTVIAKRTRSTAVKIGAYVFATSVAFQRIWNRKHWVSDVIVGGIIGYTVGEGVVKKHRSTSQNVQLTPLVKGREAGFRISF